MTDIEQMIEIIKEYDQKKNFFSVKSTPEVDRHLVFMCHPDTKKLIRTAFIESKITINRAFVHIYESNYYTPGDVYNVTDRKLKRQILKQHGVKVQGDEYAMYKTYFNYDGNMNNTTINYTYTTRTNNGFNYWG